MGLTRRGLLLGAGAAGGLVVAWALVPRAFAPPLAPGEGEYAFDAWLTIGRDGGVRVAVPDLEMGQGIGTQLAQVVAHELGADWGRVTLQPAPVSGAYGNPVLAAHWSRLWLPFAAGLADEPDDLLARRFAEREPFVATADGTALAAHEAPARAAAAAARAMLAQAAARRWGVAWEECEAQGGFIVHDRRKIGFGQLVAEASRIAPPDPPVLRAEPPAERAGEVLPGGTLAWPRLDLPAKAAGSAIFAADVRLPGMVFAAIRHGPVGKAKLIGHDAAAAAKVPGAIRVVPGEGWLAAVAGDSWAAERMLVAAAPQFAVTGPADSAALIPALRHALKFDRAERIASAGDPDRWLAGQYEHFAQYLIHPASHAPLETASAAARVADGRVELWVAAQAPQATRQAVARALGLGAADVVLYPVLAGGSFDARLDCPHAVEAALIAQAVGRPVQLTRSRWQEALASSPRAPAAAHLAARTAPDGSLVALKVRVAMPGTANEMSARLFGGASVEEGLAAQAKADPLTMAGAVPPYDIAHLAVDHVPVKTALPTARQRGNGAALGCFLIETFIDELAHRAGREPLSYRMTMLARDPQLAAVLQRAATLAQWDGGQPGSGQGLACCRMETMGRSGRIAVVATARRDGAAIRVERLTAVADLGRIVNADIARQQIEGGLVFGLGLAAGATTSWAGGLPASGRLAALGLPLLADCPQIEVEFIDSEAEPFDPGELGVAVAPPAIANALFAAGGARLHTLPLTLDPA